jgi:hypothetical protein
MPQHPTQLELSLPLLESISELGGRAKAGSRHRFDPAALLTA